MNARLRMVLQTFKKDHLKRPENWFFLNMQARDANHLIQQSLNASFQPTNFSGCPNVKRATLFFLSLWIKLTQKLQGESKNHLKISKNQGTCEKTNPEPVFQRSITINYEFC